MLRVILLLKLLVVFLVQSIQAAPDVKQCPATKEYLEQVRLAENISQPVDYACFVDIGEITIADYLVVDAREPRHNKDVLIPSSIRMSAKQLATHEFLKDNKLLLLGEGYNTTQMANLCYHLVKSGFNEVKIINNGIWAWHLASKPLSGKEGDIKQLNHVSANQVFRALHNDGFYLLVSDMYQQYLTKLIGTNQTLADLLNNKVIYFPKKTKELSAFIEKQMQRMTAMGQYPTFVLLADGQLKHNLNKQLPLRNLFILSDSIQALLVEYAKSERTAQRYGAVPNRYQCQ
ncbi:rhodanese-like domain-containing protein [Endozoicomonas sp. SM1973]|uniref:Rhodanese-like domain-containing protein n=1 Tax=Spartinivicinus marinus TaxID=2994442 RepID=A0A853I9N2_9GAMM|nr:rhodanese-like domain-containing protein [Spartinivicinus marinus]MCX4024715.1 rhodanese-like domain-containing protein [Spartinivicinus marinus]NYZ66257.1 rhodanese-like domain-containing protein [Spartinivicinus marinus]